MSGRPAPPPAGFRGPARVGVERVVTSLANETVKAIRALALRKEREATGLFVAEGLKLVADAIAEGWPIRWLVHAGTVGDQPAVRRAAAAARASGGDVLVVSEAVLGKIARRDNPQMVIGVFEQRWHGLETLLGPGATTVVALEGVKDPGNLGTILRTADAVGASGVVLLGDTTDPFSPESVRATMGSVFHVPVARATAAALIAAARGRGAPVIGTHLAGSVDYRTAAWREPGILLMGNEQSGLPADLAGAADALVRIPMAGRADSLNLAVATAVVLFEARRAHLPVVKKPRS